MIGDEGSPVPHRDCHLLQHLQIASAVRMVSLLRDQDFLETPVRFCHLCKALTHHGTEPQPLLNRPCCHTGSDAGWRAASAG